MIEQDVIVTTKHGAMPSFAVCPEGPPLPPVILYMDAYGIREELRNMARRIAKNGYFCLVPDLYYRLGTIRFDYARRSEATAQVIRPCIAHLLNDLVADDTAGMLAYLDAQDQVRSGPVGCVGYCMSGQYVTTVAARFPLRIAGAASLFGTRLVTDREDLPHKFIRNIRGEMYFGFAEHDAFVPESVIPTLRATLDEAGTRYTLDIYRGAHHGFCFPERQDYDAAASEESWTKVLDLWDRTLR